MAFTAWGWPPAKPAAGGRIWKTKARPIGLISVPSGWKTPSGWPDGRGIVILQKKSHWFFAVLFHFRSSALLTPNSMFGVQEKSGKAHAFPDFFDCIFCSAVSGAASVPVQEITPARRPSAVPKRNPSDPLADYPGEPLPDPSRKASPPSSGDPPFLLLCQHHGHDYCRRQPRTPRPVPHK